jgi:putative ABC transport system ATP-binding protein
LEAIVRLLVRVPREFKVATVMVSHDTEYIPLTDAVATMLDGRLTALEQVAV